MWYRKIRIEENGCWTWLGYINPKGYGQLTRKGKTYKAHRYIYEQLKGTISTRLHLHHTCETKSCVNPWHVQLTTTEEHNKIHAKATKTHCARGHIRTEGSTFKTARGQEVCRECNKEYLRKSRAKNP